MTPIPSMTLSPEGILIALVAACAGIMFLAVTTGTFLPVVNQRLAVLRQKMFYDKLAQQTASMTASLSLLTLVCVAAAVAHVLVRSPELLQEPFHAPMIACAAALLTFVLLYLAYSIFWRALRRTKNLHIALGSVTALAGLTALYMTTALTFALLYRGHPIPASATMDQALSAIYLASPPSALWIVFTQTIFGGIACSAMLAQLYLFLRRAKDDFGRDYYKFALPVCARWAAAGAVLQCLPATALFLLLRSTSGPLLPANPVMWYWGTALLLPLCCAGLWLRIARSENPMRHKASVILCVFLMTCATTAQLLAGFFQTAQ